MSFVKVFIKSFKANAKPVYAKLMALFPARISVIIGYVLAHYRLPNLKNPQTLNEKILWRKLYERDLRLPDLIDKIKAKEIIGMKYGKDLIIPTLAVYDWPDEMDFTKPPLSQPPYVIKVNHSTDMNLFVEEDSFKPEKIKKKLKAFLKYSHEDYAAEWAYALIKKCIYIEPFIRMPNGYLTDYKFHVFSGKVYAIGKMIADEFKNLEYNVYDRNWNLLDLQFGYPRHKTPLAPPVRLGDMIKLAELIGKDFAYVRVDLYEIDQQVKFGELTFYPGAGHDAFDPPEWDYKFGQQWKQSWDIPQR